jgi:stress-induced morphogen
MNNLEMVKNLILSKIPDAEVEVSDLTGTLDHIGINVKSSVFQGKALIEQHQIIMNILNDSLKDKIHAVKIKTQKK